MRQYFNQRYLIYIWFSLSSCPHPLGVKCLTGPEPCCQKYRSHDGLIWGQRCSIIQHSRLSSPSSQIGTRLIVSHPLSQLPELTLSVTLELSQSKNPISFVYIAFYVHLVNRDEFAAPGIEENHVCASSQLHLYILIAWIANRIVPRTQTRQVCVDLDNIRIPTHLKILNTGPGSKIGI